MEPRVAEIIALLFIFCCAVDGYTKGLVMKVYSLVHFILVLVATIVLVPVILPMIPMGLEARGGIAFVAAFVVSLVVFGVIAAALKIVDRIPIVNEVNKLGGGILGTVLGLMFLWILLLVVDAFQNMEWCRMISQCVSQSQILTIIQEYNFLAYLLQQFY